MKIIRLIILSFVLYGCGQVQADPPGQPGVFADITINAMLEKNFNEVKECTKLANGSFSDVAVVFVAPNQLVVNGKTALGDFIAPNTLNVEVMKKNSDSVTTFRHEAIHYLLYLNTGDSDANHNSPFFNSCVEW